MGMQAIYRKPRTSQPNQAHRIYPYLLKDVTIERPNQDWAESDKVRPHVAAWYRSAIGAPGPVLLPIVDRKRSVGLIYADINSPATLHFSSGELGLLKTMRNQAVLAMRQHS
jgi:hypothetical protein